MHSKPHGRTSHFARASEYRSDDRQPEALEALSFEVQRADFVLCLLQELSHPSAEAVEERQWVTKHVHAAE